MILNQPNQRSLIALMRWRHTMQDPIQSAKPLRPLQRPRDGHVGRRRGGFAAVRDRRGTVSCLNDQSGKERFRGFGILRLTVSLYTPVYAHYEHQFDIYIFSTDLTKPVLHHHAAQGVSGAANGLPVVRNG